MSKRRMIIEEINGNIKLLNKSLIDKSIIVHIPYCECSKINTI